MAIAHVTLSHIGKDHDYFSHFLGVKIHSIKYLKKVILYLLIYFLIKYNLVTLFNIFIISKDNIQLGQSAYY